MTSVILAGAALHGPLAARAGTTVKALAPVGGRPLLEAIWEAVESQGPMVVVGPEAVRPWATRRPQDRWVPAGATGTDNILNALMRVPPDEPCLLCASDLPFATPEAVADLLRQTSEPADLHYPLVSQPAMAEAFPGYRRRFVPIREGRFTGGSVLQVRPGALLKARATLEAVFEARKNTVRIAAMLGLPFLIRRLLGTLRAADVERQAARIVGLHCRAVLHSPPCLALDVDSVADYEYCEGIGASGRSSRRG